jgi:hypothetical protein
MKYVITVIVVIKYHKEVLMLLYVGLIAVVIVVLLICILMFQILSLKKTVVNQNDSIKGIYDVINQKMNMMDEITASYKQELENALNILDEKYQLFEILTDENDKKLKNLLAFIENKSELLEQITAENEQELKNVLDIVKLKSDTLEAVVSLRTSQILMQLNKKEKNLNTDAVNWILETNNVKKYFKPGQIEKVVNEKDNSEFKYEFTDDGMVCSVYIDGVLDVKTEFSKFGAPLKGYKYNPQGEVIGSFVYDELGNVKKQEIA